MSWLSTLLWAKFEIFFSCKNRISLHQNMIYTVIYKADDYIYECINTLLESIKNKNDIKYYLINEQECFIGFKTRGEAERFISDKARIASILNSFKNDPFYTHFVSGFAKEFSK